MLDIRKRQPVRERPPTEVAAFWTGEDLLDGRPTKSHTIIFRTRGCYWGPTRRLHHVRLHRRRGDESSDAR
jgi:uncharacterized Fe-S cluster-containing MiaB family protein